MTAKAQTIAKEIEDWHNAYARRGFYDYTVFIERLNYEDIELPSGTAKKIEQTFESEDTTLIFSVGDDLFGIDGDTSSWDGAEWDSAPYEVFGREVTTTKYYRV